MKFLAVLLLVFIENAFLESNKVPEWENLECEVIMQIKQSYSLFFNFNFQVGHKYLFVNAPNTWDDAIVECQANGGWLGEILF